MNYIAQITGFWRLHREMNFSTAEIALYGYLLEVCNGLGWKNPFNHSNTYIVGVLGISEKTLITARKALQEAGLIEFTAGGGRRYSSLYFIKPCNNSTLSGTLSEEHPHKGSRKGCNNSTLSGGNGTDNNKPNETKPNIKTDAGETCVSQSAHDFKMGDFNDDYFDGGTEVPTKEETSLNAKFDKNNFGVETEEEKKKLRQKEKKVAVDKPTLEEVTAYCRERGNNVDPQQWFDHYTANGWKVGKNSMRDWKAAVRTWERNGYNSNSNGRNTNNFTAVPGKCSVGGFEDTL